jgi:hypothetical protein
MPPRYAVHAGRAAARGYEDAGIRDEDSWYGFRCDAKPVPGVFFTAGSIYQVALTHGR